MDLKVGIFVRTKHRNEVVIRQVKNIFETSEHDHQLFFDKPTKYEYYIEDNNFIAKENPIELIEIGDYVNGCRVRATYLEGIRKYIKLDCNPHERWYEEDIKTIVTKERFERESYKLGDD